MPTVKKLDALTTLYVWIRNPHDMRILSLAQNRYFVTRYHTLVLESASNNAMRYNLVLYIYFQSNDLQFC